VLAGQDQPSSEANLRLCGTIAAPRHSLRALPTRCDVVKEFLEGCPGADGVLRGSDAWDMFLTPKRLPFPTRAATRVWGSALRGRRNLADRQMKLPSRLPRLHQSTSINDPCCTCFSKLTASLEFPPRLLLLASPTNGEHVCDHQALRLGSAPSRCVCCTWLKAPFCRRLTAGRTPCHLLANWV
jgi:hypothetical protein